MNTYIALLRGINVGGHNKLPMAELRELLDDLGLQNIQTYIQSGNVVFKSEDQDTSVLAKRIGEAIDERYGFKPTILVLTREEFEDAIASNPFPEAKNEPKTLHLYFLESPPQEVDLEKLEEVKKSNERFALLRKVFYLHAPDGIGRSKLAERVERVLKVSVTARNWRTVNKIAEMLNG